MNSGSTFLDGMVTSQHRGLAAVSDAMRRDTRERAWAAVKGREAHRLFKALRTTEAVNVIAEVKRSSPSAGAIHATADAVAQAVAYESAGAASISVLTEPEYFKGSMQDLMDVVARVKIPVLRKDFTVDRHQIYEAAAAGASAVLLIVAALSAEDLRELRLVAEDELGLDALVEAHTAVEVEAAIACGARLVGINNRNLQTLEVTLDTARELARYIDDSRVFVAESGIKTAADVGGLQALGYKAFLVGEALMRAQDPASALRALVQGAAR